MEISEKCRNHVLVLLVFLLHFSNLHFLSFADDSYYINCGSRVNVNITTAISVQKFFADSKSNKDIAAVTNQLPASLSADAQKLYQTARASSDPFYYEFEVTTGTYLVRLHFLAFSSSTSNLSAAVFDVAGLLVPTNFTLLKNFAAKNITDSPLIKEFFLITNSSGSFKLYFTPRASSLAFINAIEFFTVQDFTNSVLENFTSFRSLQTIYRVNVGGPSQNDTFVRSWETDDSYLLDPNSAKTTNKSVLSRIVKDEFDGFIVSSNSVAPDFVYQTAKTMNSAASRPANSSNITWSFRVSENARHVVRAHFCDIVGVADNNVRFKLYSNGNFIKNVSAIKLSDPFYYDFVVNTSEAGLINLSIRPADDATEQNAYLNGIEMLEIMEGVASIPNVKESKKNMVALVVGSVLGGLTLICILVAGLVFLLRQRKAEKRVETSDWSPMPANGGGTERTITGPPMNLGLKISLSEIQSATNNFDTKLLIGKGGFGNVYSGTLLNGTKVAVKRAYKRDEQGSGSGQGFPEFETEIMVLYKIRHRHLVSLIGYCDERSEMILIYEFMEKGTLRDNLYGSDFPSLTWKQRLEICSGAARGLHYLHTGAAGGIIHRDVKSTNILLDENHVAKVADFGLSRSGSLDETHVSTIVKGTIGYLDPEYMMSEQLTEKSDVYSFGVVLLEVLCGRPPIDSTLKREQMNLAEWVMTFKKKGLLEQIVDSSLKSQIDPSSLRKFAETAEKCLHEDASDRPTMADVLWDLEYALQLQQTTKLKEAYEDSTTTAASSAAFGLPIMQRFPSLGSTMNGDEMRDDELDTTENEIFSQLKMGDAR